MGLLDKIKKLWGKEIDPMKQRGRLIASNRAKYLGGHPDVVGEKAGKISIYDQGVFFGNASTFTYIYIPAGNISKAEFQSGEQIAKNAYFSRLLAFDGFKFAFKKNTASKHLYLTVSYYENRLENTLLFETRVANELASMIAKVRQDFAADRFKKGESDLPPSELIKQISELYALGMLTKEEYAEKKRDFLSRL